MNIQQNITSVEKNISDLEYNLKNQNQNYSAYSEISHDETLARENMRLEVLTSISDNIKSNEANIVSLERQLADIELNIKNAEVISPVDGTVNMYSDLRESDFVQSGQTVATIIPDTNGAYKLMMYLSSADISETEIGQNVRLRFAAYPYQEYGEFSGTVKVFRPMSDQATMALHTMLQRSTLMIQWDWSLFREWNVRQELLPNKEK